MEDSFKKKGYQVVGEESPGVHVVDVSIEKFWCWSTPGFWSIGLESIFALNLSSHNNKVLVSSPVTATGYIQLHTQMATGSKYRNTIDKGILVLEEDILRKIRYPQ